MKTPIGQLLLRNSENESILEYCHEDDVCLRLSFHSEQTVYYKKGSDGDLQTDPPLHQLIFHVPEECDVTIEFFLPDGILLRPQRAAEGEAILSQSGKPLIYGINGLYDQSSDTYFTWYGIQWYFVGDRILHTQDTDYIRIEGHITPGAPLLINIQQNYYQKHLGFDNHDPRQRIHNPKTICGWCSWEAYGFDVSLTGVEKTARFLSKELRGYGLSYLQIDDGYQPQMMPPEGTESLKDGWLFTNEKFPGGHEAIVKTIEENGFQAGIWLNATINNPEYAKHSGHCFVEDGEPLKVVWLNYVFNCSDRSLNEEIVPVYTRLAELGYTYFKVDAIRHLIFDGLAEAVRRGLISRQEAQDKFRAYMQAIRKSIGESNYLLSCWGVITESVGLCDALRFATDANDSVQSFYMQIKESARWHHTHGILFKNDPDHLCLRCEEAAAQSLSVFTSLNGYLYMLSDEVDFYTPEKLDIIRTSIPPVDASAAETGPLDITFGANYYPNLAKAYESKSGMMPGNLWTTHFSQTGRNWAVVQYINLSGDNGDVIIPLASLSLDPGKTYFAFDFMTQEPLGFVGDRLVLQAPVLRGSKIIALTPCEGEVQLIGSSRHVSMDSISVKDIVRTEIKLVLKLSGVAGKSFDYWFYVPEGMSFSASSQKGNPISVDEVDSCRKVCIRFTDPEDVLQVEYC